jgi:hypothetical protein
MNMARTIFCGFSLLLSAALFAQEKSFPANIPYQSRVEVNAGALENLFHLNGNFSLVLGPSFTLSGSIMSRVSKPGSVTTLLIKTENLQGATLTLSRSPMPDGSFQYTGHLLKLHDADGMLLVEKDRHYYFIKTEQRFLVSE